MRPLLSFGLLLGACSSTDHEYSDEFYVDRRALISEPFFEDSTCAEVCNLAFSVGCGVTDDCVEDCEQDLRDCPSEMQQVLTCHEAAPMSCQAGEDSEIDPAPCLDEHMAVHDCGHDPF